MLPNLEIKTAWISRLFTKAKKDVLTRDPYVKLAEFEREMVRFMSENSVLKPQLLEARKVLAIVNNAQIRLLERELGEDLNGDGKIG